MSLHVVSVHSLLAKRHSWPSLRAERSARISATIDQNPYPYFLTPSIDNEDILDDDLTAGISSRHRSHSAPFHNKRRHKPLISDKVIMQITRLKIWIKRMETSHFQSSSPTPILVHPPPHTPITLDELPTFQRGRDIHATATSRVRNNIRSPARKPRAWRRPSDNIWPVAEESESSSTVGLGIKT